MRVQRRSLALVESVFEKEERTIRLLGRGLPEVHTAAVEPAPLTFLDCADDRSGCRQVDRSVHGAASLAGAGTLWDRSPITKLRYHIQRVNPIRVRRSHRTEAANPRGTGVGCPTACLRGRDPNRRRGGSRSVDLAHYGLPVLSESTSAARGRASGNGGPEPAACGPTGRSCGATRRGDRGVHPHHHRDRVPATHDAAALAGVRPSRTDPVAATPGTGDRVDRGGAGTSALSVGPRAITSPRVRHSKRGRDRGARLVNRCRRAFASRRRRSHALVGRRIASFGPDSLVTAKRRRP